MSSESNKLIADQAGSVFFSQASAADYWALLKPRVMSLVVFTGVVGYLLAPQNLHPLLGFIAILALALGAGSAGALNMYYERALDARMTRTQSRPLPQQRMHPSDALAFALILSAASLTIMWLAAGTIPAALLLFSIVYYAVFYTMWLKPITAQNIVIGGAAGAFPPMIGWVVASGQFSVDSLVLFAIIFFWTPPHFWALALFRKDDYAAVGLPMLPNTHGIPATKQQILLYTVLLLPLSLLPTVLGTVGVVYLVVALCMGGVFCWRAWQLYRAVAHEAIARRLFGFSIVYLFVLFGSLLFDRLLYATLALVGY